MDAATKLKFKFRGGGIVLHKRRTRFRNAEEDGEEFERKSTRRPRIRSGRMHFVKGREKITQAN